ncbi:MAG: class I SAM-dependent methyltransferase [Bacteroidetes bacterium]|nr:class I SAM-dependent methyltransferase [Bacteroidota bacterium]
MKLISFLLKYLKYWFFAKTAHGIHSPFVFELYNEVINKKGNYYSFDKIELLRRKLLISNKEIEVTDLGTGKSGKRTVSEIAERSAKDKKYCELLFRLAYHFKPNTILELGTSLGISTAYLASANPNSKVITIEGCPNTANEARKNFQSLSLENIESITGNFEDVLYQLPIANCQLVFFDGNHKKKPTLKYFSQCLESTHNDSIFIFDDIHWSDEMEEALEEIKSHPKVTVTVDLFFLGLVFFRKGQVKENFIIRY